MLALNLEIDDFFFRDIKKDELNKVLELYNDVDESIFATGIDRQLSIEEMGEKYLEVLINSYEFFIGIFSKGNEELIGVIKGHIDYDNSEEAWISSFLIKKDFRNTGIGNKSINAFISFMNKTYDVKKVLAGVISKNKRGMEFWINAGFQHIRVIKEYISLNNGYEDFIILKKDIKTFNK